MIRETMRCTSASPFEIHHILTGLDKSPETMIENELFLPQGDGPFGCVVALHGSKGWAEHHQDHINGWLDAGLAVCKVNSFTSRGIDSTVDDQLSVTHAMMLVDVFRARSALALDPRIGKIGIAGWSLGGTVALYSAWSPIIEILGAPFDAHLPFYPAAHIRPDIKKWSDSSILILHGDADDWTPLHMVEALMPQFPNATLQIYPGAHHSFDSVKELTWIPTAVRLKKRTARIDKNGYMSGELFPGIRLPLNERWQRRWIVRILRNRGAHVQGNPSARADSLERARQFLIDTIGD
ncbi:MAG: dienelactone hydrolase family protein [Candidatus Thalassarchaeaceae archaeon]|nr:dienelactone hydrolase family protein [Candidatus Thalassarchaeaceae archaeon]